MDETERTRWSTDGKLDEVYERLVNPQVMTNIERYFGAERSA